MDLLFSNLGNDSSSSSNLVEFKAGKMHMRGTTVTADKRKGLVYVHQSGDSLMHFCWKDRTTGVIEDDLIIFPDDIEYKKVPQCTTGRAFVLKFKLSSRKFFFWMQEPKDDKDDEYCKKVNEYLNNPPAPGSAEGGSNSPGLTSQSLFSLARELRNDDFQSLLSGMDQSQIMQFLSSSGLGGSSSELRSNSRSSTSRSASSVNQTPRPNSQSSTATTTATATQPTTTTQSTPAVTMTSTETTAASTNSKAPVQLSDLQNILAGINTPQQAQQEPVDLSTSFSSDALAPLFADAGIRQRLCQFLPEVNELSNSEQEIKEAIQSPQFKQALSTFSAALQSGQLAPLMQQFGLGTEATNAAAKGDILAFVKALQNAETNKATKNDNEDADDDMGLD